MQLCRKRDQRGAVTAEAAVVLPLLIAVAMALAWLVGLGVAQVRCVDAAREVARAVARGDDASTALATGRRVAPDGARFTIDTDGDLAVVRVSARLSGPGGFLRFLRGPELTAESTSLRESG